MYIIPAIAFDAGGGAPSEARAGGGWVLRMAPIMKNKLPMPIAETNKETLRPSVSTPKKIEMVVAVTFTTPMKYHNYGVTLG